MSKYDPFISQETRMKMRGWQDGDISIVNGTYRRFNVITMTWPEIFEDEYPEWLKKKKINPSKGYNFRADGTPYERGFIFSEDTAFVGGRVYGMPKKRHWWSNTVHN